MKTVNSVLTKKVEVEKVQHESRSFAGSMRHRHAVEIRFDINGDYMHIETISIRAAMELHKHLTAILVKEGK